MRLADGSLVTPGSILPVAEKAGLVRLLDQRVLELALEKMSADPALRLSVNASLSTVLDPEWPRPSDAFAGRATQASPSG